MKRFDYLAPENLTEALEMMKERTEATPLAGGTDLLVQIKEHHRPVRTLLSLRRLTELKGYKQNGGFTFGATVNAARISADVQVQQVYTALAVGAGLIGSPQIRTMATIGGNLCNASPSADTAPPLLVLGAQAVIAGEGGERRVLLEDFFTGPGRTVISMGELLKEIYLPEIPPRSGSTYLRHTPRAWMDLAFVGVAAFVTLDGEGNIQQARIALGAVAPTPVRALAAEALLEGQPLTPELLAAAGERAAEAAQPIDDLRASRDYRRHLVDVMTQRAISQAAAQAEGKNGI